MSTQPAPFTEHELVALIDLAGTEAARAVAGCLGLAPLATDERSLRAGYSTLLVRDLATVGDTAVEARGEALVVGTAFARSIETMVVAVGRDETLLAHTLLVRAEEVAVMLELTAFGIRMATPIDPALPATELTARLLAAVTQEATFEGDCRVEAVRVVPGSDPAAVRLHKRADGMWRVDDGRLVGSVWASVEQVWRDAVARLSA